MGMPSDVFLCFDDVVVRNSTLLVPDGSYNVVQLPSEDFRSVTIWIPGANESERQSVVLDAFVEATVGSLIRAVEERKPSLFAQHPNATAVLVDCTHCLLDFDLLICMIPFDSSNLQLAFV